MNKALTEMQTLRAGLRRSQKFPPHRRSPS